MTNPFPKAKSRAHSRTVLRVAGGLMLICLGIVAAIENFHLSAAALLLLFFLGTLVEPIFTSTLNQPMPDRVQATGLSCTSLPASAIVMTARPGMGYLADLNIVYPFGLDIAAVGAGVLALLLAWPKTTKEKF